MASVVKLIFAPVIFTAFLSLILIFTFSVWGLLTSNGEHTLNDMIFTTTAEGSSVEIPGIASTTIEGMKTGFVDLLIYFALIFLMWMLMRVAVDMISKDGPPIMGKIFGKLGSDGGLLWGLQKLPTSAQILPWPKWPMSITGAQEFMKQQKLKTKSALGLDDTALGQQEAALNRALWLGERWTADWTSDLTSDISDNTSKWSNFFTKSKGYLSRIGGGTINHPSWEPIVVKYLQKEGRADKEVLPKMTEDNLAEYFKDKSKVKAFSKEMWKEVSSRSELQKTKFGK